MDEVIYKLNGMCVPLEKLNLQQVLTFTNIYWARIMCQALEKYFTSIFSFYFSQKSYNVDTVTTLVLQMRKPRLTKVKGLDQDYTGNWNVQLK